MKALGFRPEDYPEEEERDCVWPDNWLPAALFGDLATQWRMGYAGPIGLDYGVLPTVSRFRGVKRAEWSQLFTDLQVMEQEVLSMFAEQRRET